MANSFGKRGVGRKWYPLTFLVLVLAGAIQCNKTGGLNSNRANLLLVHTAQGHGALDYGDVSSTGNGDSLKFSSILSNPLTYGTSTGVVNSRFPFQDSGVYTSVKVGVNSVGVQRVSDGKLISTGSTTFNYGRNYTMFLFDDSAVVADSVRIFTLPDNLRISTDTFAFIRWLNFSPSSYLNFRMDANRGYDSIRDSLITGFQNFVGDRQVISTYNFRQIHPGYYWIRIYYDIDSVTRLPNKFYQMPDSFNIVRDKSYTAFVQGSPDSLTGDKKLRVRLIQHN